MSLPTFRVAVGRAFLVAGVLVLLFIPYLLWGTGLITARAQSDLRQQFADTQRDHHVPAVPRVPATPVSPPVLAALIAPPPLGGPVGIISIPKISVSMVVVEGTDADQLRSGPGHYPGTPLPGEAGNVAIAGHRTTYLHPFYGLDALVPGDAINITTVQGLFVYHVVSSRVVDPTDVAVVAPTPTPLLTLTTCNPRYSARQRLVVQSALVSDLLTATTSPVLSVVSPAKAPPAPAPSTIQKDWWAATGWGLAVVVVVTGLWTLVLRIRGARRVALVVGGILAWLMVVYLFFGALAPLLPASF